MYSDPAEILRAGQLVGKYQRHQVLRIVALERRRDLLAGAKTRHRQRDIADPAPARRKHWRIEQGLHQHLLDRIGFQVAGRFLERKAVGRAQ